MKDSRSPRSSANARGQGSYVSRACSVCRHKKIKCDGGKPCCETCINNGRGSECTYGKEAGRRPRTEAHFQAMHQRIEILGQYIRQLESLLELCQKEHPGSAAFAYQQFRPADWDEPPVSHSPDEVLNDFPEDEEREDVDGGVADELCLPTRNLSLAEEGGLLLHGAAAPFRYISERPQSTAGRLLAISENPDECYTLLVDGADESHFNPNFDWSRHLPPEVHLNRREHDRILDLVFKFITSWCLRIVPPLFLRDMCRALNVPKNQIPPRQTHYSPMLHNAILAIGTAFSDDPAIRDLRARMYFLEKASSYLDEECSTPHLCVVQALGLIGSFHSSQGDRTLGYIYFGMSGRVGQALGLSVDCSSWVESGYITAEDQVDRNWVYWSTFCQDVCWSLGVGRDFCIPGVSTSIAIPFTDADFDKMDWVYRPTGMEPQPGYEATTFQATCGLLVVAKRIMDLVNTLNGPKSPQWVLDQKISDIDLALHQWHSNLPEVLKNTVRMRSNPTPHLLQLHLTFRWCFILLHRPFCRRRSKAVLARENVIDHVKICKQASDEIMGLMDTWRKHFPLRYASTRLIRPVFAAGTIYLFSARLAVKGMRPAMKELRHAMKNTHHCIELLKEIGGTWPCALKMAEIVKDLWRTRVQPEISELAGLSPASSGILPPKEQEEHERGRTNGARDGNRKKPNSTSRKRRKSSSVEDNSHASKNSDPRQGIENGISPNSLSRSRSSGRGVITAVHNPLEAPSPLSFQGQSSLSSLPTEASLQHLPVQPTQPIPISPQRQLWTGLSVGGDGSHPHSMPLVERPAAPAPTLEQSLSQSRSRSLSQPLSQQPQHAQPNLNSFSVNRTMNALTSHPQLTSQDGHTWVPSALLSTTPTVSTNGNARPMSPMSYLLAMPDGRGLWETPFVPFSAELGEDPTAMAALNQLGFELVSPQLGEEMSTELVDMDMDMDIERGEREGWDDLDLEEYTNLWE